MKAVKYRAEFRMPDSSKVYVIEREVLDKSVIVSDIEKYGGELIKRVRKVK